MTSEELKSLVRNVPDFPKRGILFRDVTTLIGDGAGFAASVGHLADRVQATGAKAVAGIEARGFIFGAAVAARLGVAFIPVRKPGKLPVPALSRDYVLEYGTDTLEVDPGAVSQGGRLAVIDDLVATGGTAVAAVELLRQAGALIDHAFFVIDLPDLGGADRLRSIGVTAEALMDFPGD